MSDVDLPDVDAITVGSVGPPGGRVFYLQAVAGRHIHSWKIEKQQVAALAGAIVEFLADVVVSEPLALPDLVDPGEPDWIVATMGLTGLDEVTGRVTLVLGELTAEEDDAGSVARLGLTLAQLAALAVRCDAALEGGRPPCPLCGRPLDPEGHVCPKTNGAATH